MELSINTKADTNTDVNTSHEFRPNAQGLYNLSKMIEIFIPIEQEKARIEEADSEFLEARIKGIATGAYMLCYHMEESDDFKKIDGEYWASYEMFTLMMKGHSKTFGDAVNGLESEGDMSIRDYSILITKKYSVLQIYADTQGGYQSFCIHNLFKLFDNFESVYNFTVDLVCYFQKLENENNLDSTFLEVAWKIAFENMRDLFATHSRFDPEWKDPDAFFIRYRAAQQKIKDDVAADVASYIARKAPVAQPKKESWLSKFFK